MKKIYLVLLSMLLMASCKEAPEVVEDNSADEALANSLEPAGGRMVSLTPEAMNVASQWLAFVTAQNEIRDLRNATGHQIISNADPLRQIMNSLSSTLPETLKVTPIESRVTVLVTKAEVLHQQTTKKNRSAAEIFEAATSLINEFENFKLQLNERFLPAPGDFQQELDRQFNLTVDSIQQND